MIEGTSLTMGKKKVLVLFYLNLVNSWLVLQIVAFKNQFFLEWCQIVVQRLYCMVLYN